MDTDLEIGAIIRRTHETYGPATLFSNIRGHAGYRVVGAPMSYSSHPDARMARVAIALGLDPATGGPQIVETLARAMHNEPIPPMVVPAAPCQQNVLLGDNTDLLKFPTPMIHNGDGGRYFNTLGIWVLRSPDGKWTNWSIARAMLIDGQRMTGFIAGSQHNSLILEMWRERGEPMPFALVQGAEPAALYVGGMPLPPHVDENAYLGGHFGEPIETVHCKTVDLYVPASAEIVVEGHVSLDETWPEGPMGEYHGYLNGEVHPFPIYHVSAITHRDNPILPVCSAGKPVDEDHTIVCPGISAVLLNELRAHDLPITSVWFVPESATHLLTVTLSPDWAQRCGVSAAELGRRIVEICKNEPSVEHAGRWFSRLMLIDQDIDPTDMRDLMWAWATRCHTSYGSTVLDMPISILSPVFTDAERFSQRGPVQVLDCLLRDGLSSTAFAENFPADLQRRVLAEWDE
ncbi:UbiD family decarboxylase [Nocardia sp. NPDC051570]|uniref:UbiD family decarboxylase n=1 Tax=Nocardia sp. NPDC051570 TaxID=3364324 RepID=UPI0037AA2F8D